MEQAHKIAVRIWRVAFSPVEEDFEHAGFFWRLDEKKGLARAYPAATADLVLFYLHSPLKYFFPDEHTASVWRDYAKVGSRQRS